MKFHDFFEKYLQIASIVGRRKKQHLLAYIRKYFMNTLVNILLTGVRIHIGLPPNDIKISAC